jgi:hypothetical protein
MKQTQAPLACDMTAIPAERRASHLATSRESFARIEEVRELPDGYEFEFPFNSPTYTALSEITPLEHACCPFFNIAIRREENSLLWQLTGSEGAKQFIRMEFAAWFK